MVTQIQFDKYLETATNLLQDSASLLFGKNLTETLVSSELLGPIDTTKRLDDTPVITEIMTRSISTSLSEIYSNLTENYSYSIEKPLSETVTISENIVSKEFYKTVTDVNVATITESLTQSIDKVLEDTYLSTAITELLTRSLDKSLTDTPIVTEQIANELTKYVTDTSVGTFTHSGYIKLNPYEEGGYFLELYANAYDSTF